MGRVINLDCMRYSSEPPHLQSFQQDEHTDPYAANAVGVSAREQFEHNEKYYVPTDEEVRSALEKQRQARRA